MMIRVRTRLSIDDERKPPMSVSRLLARSLLASARSAPCTRTHCGLFLFYFQCLSLLSIFLRLDLSDLLLGCCHNSLSCKGLVCLGLPFSACLRFLGSNALVYQGHQ